MTTRDRWAALRCRFPARCSLRTAAHYALMWTIRYTPAPWRLKRELIWRATPRMPVIGAAIIPDSEGRILMLRARYSGRWILPGGAVHPGEDPLAGVRRECREELGCDIGSLSPAGCYMLAGAREVFMVYRAEPLAAMPRLGPEHEAFRYLPPDHLPPWARVMAEDAQAAGTIAPVMRTLTGPSGKAP